jgi:hypothetical protein
VRESTETNALWTDTGTAHEECAFIYRFVQNAHLRTNAIRMRITKCIFALTMSVCGCTAVPKRVAKVEHAIVQNQQQLARIKDSYDLSEQNIARIRLSVSALVDRGRIVSQQLEKAACDFQMAAVKNHLANNDFVHAASSFQRAANTYRQIASLIILLASSGRFLDALCKQPMCVDRYHTMLGMFGVKLDQTDVEDIIPRIIGKQNIEQVAPNEVPSELRELPLPVMNVLVKEATRMLLCEKGSSSSLP